VKEKKLKRLCPDRPAKFVNLNLKQTMRASAYTSLAPKDYIGLVGEKGEKKEALRGSSWNAGEVNFVV